MKQASTAIRVFHRDVSPTLAVRHTFVREQLVAFVGEYHYGPTALELLRFVAQHHSRLRADVNLVRPRLTEMEKLGWVRHGAERPCDVSKKTVMTWLPATPHQSGQATLSFEAHT